MANKPYQVWTSDIACIATDEAWLYLAVVLDLFIRQRVGWSMQAHMQSSLITGALRMAWLRCEPEPVGVFHSDQLNPPNTAGTRFSRRSRTAR
jgi:transposase InsO family protein